MRHDVQPTYKNTEVSFKNSLNCRVLIVRLQRTALILEILIPQENLQKHFKKLRKIKMYWLTMQVTKIYFLHFEVWTYCSVRSLIAFNCLN